jgi:hypothetical protein
MHGMKNVNKEIIKNLMECKIFKLRFIAFDVYCYKILVTEFSPDTTIKTVNFYVNYFKVAHSVHFYVILPRLLKQPKHSINYT